MKKAKRNSQRITLLVIVILGLLLTGTAMVSANLETFLVKAVRIKKTKIYQVMSHKRRE